MSRVVLSAALFCALAVPLLLPETLIPETGNNIPQQKPRVAGDPESVQAKIDGIVSTLTSISVRENISRFAGVHGATRKLDSFETEVSIADGTEQYSEVRGKRRTYRHISEIGGLWSFGEIVTMLRTTRELIGSANRNPLGEGSLGEAEPAEQLTIGFHCEAAQHQWFVTMDGRILWLGFTGVVRVSTLTGDIERLTWISAGGPEQSGIKSILWDVNFQTATVAGGLFRMPSDSIFQVIRTGNERKTEWNLTRYLPLGRYGSTASLSFGP